MPLPCLKCGKQLDDAFGPDNEQPGANQPHAGTAFITHGHYGSTVFDPMDGSYLEINICDECLTKAAELGLVFEGHTTKAVKTTLTKWKGPHRRLS